MIDYLFHVALHLKRSIKLLETVLALSDVRQINILLFLRIYMCLAVHHYSHIVIQHFMAVPTLKRNGIAMVMDHIKS